MNGLPVHADHSLPHGLSIQQTVIFKHAAANALDFRKASLTERSQLLRLASLIKSSRLSTFADEEESSGGAIQPGFIKLAKSGAVRRRPVSTRIGIRPRCGLADLDRPDDIRAA